METELITMRAIRNFWNKSSSPLVMESNVM